MATQRWAILHVQGGVASAGSEHWDASGCVFTNAWVMAFENLTHPTSAGGYQGPSAVVGLFRYNYCTGDPASAIDAYGFADNITFHVDGSLVSGSASGTATLTDYYTGAAIPATFNISWKGAGSVFSTIDSYHIRTLNTVQHYRMNASGRFAVGTGNITIGGTNYLTTPSAGDLMNSQGGTVTIEHQ